MHSAIRYMINFHKRPKFQKEMFILCTQNIQVVSHQDELLRKVQFLLVATHDLLCRICILWVHYFNILHIQISSLFKEDKLFYVILFNLSLTRNDAVEMIMIMMIIDDNKLTIHPFINYQWSVVKQVHRFCRWSFILT